MKKKGVFICIEGLDGSGKTTHAHRLVRNLQEQGFDTIYTTEPSRREYGKFIRHSVLQGEKRLPTVVEALLFAVDRVDHLEKEVKPAVREGKIVVSDRYVYSSLAYQGAAGLDSKWIEEINKLAISPDLALYIDVPPEVVVKRIRRKKSVMETLETQQKVRDVYMKFVENGKLLPLDGNRKKIEVEKTILETVLDFLKDHKAWKSGSSSKWDYADRKVTNSLATNFDKNTSMFFNCKIFGLRVKNWKEKVPSFCICPVTGFLYGYNPLFLGLESKCIR